MRASEAELGICCLLLRHALPIALSAKTDPATAESEIATLYGDTLTDAIDDVCT